MEAASKLCPRKESRKSSEELENAIKILKKKLSKRNTLGLNSIQVREELKTKTRIHGRKLEQISNLKEFISKSDSFLKKRKEQLERQQGEIIKKTKFFFRNFMHRKEASGKLEFDLENSLLNISVKRFSLISLISLVFLLLNLSY